MSNPNKAPKHKARKVTAGIVALAIAAGAGYEGSAVVHNGDAAAASAKTKKELVKKLAGHPKAAERFAFVESQTPERIRSTESDEALFENAAKVQASIFAISSEVGLSGQEVFERLVSPEARQAYENRSMHFLFVEDSPDNPYCYNPFALGGEGDKIDGTHMIGYLPLDASPDNLHPDPNPNSYHTAQNSAQPGAMAGHVRIIQVPDTPDLHQWR